VLTSGSFPRDDPRPKGSDVECKPPEKKKKKNQLSILVEGSLRGRIRTLGGFGQKETGSSPIRNGDNDVWK